MKGKFLIFKKEGRFQLLLSVYAILVILFFISGCQKDRVITSSDATLFITADTLKFDTVFTTTASVTKQFKIVNTNSQRLNLTSVKLSGGAASPFKLNINGVAGSVQQNLEIRANDSLYVFVSLTASPSSANIPFVLTDSIEVVYNGNTRLVQLQAYGQNAIFLDGVSLKQNTRFTSERPYVIFGGLQVMPGVTLTLDAGTKIFSHANAPILVDGTMLSNGIFSNPVIFSGDRLDEPYANYPGSWPGIYFRSTSRDNSLLFTQIKNATQALVVTGVSNNMQPKLRAQQCIVDNAVIAGIYAVNSSFDINNTLLSNCGTNILIEGGGVYKATNCTVASYGNNFLQHKNLVLSLSNGIVLNGQMQDNPLTALFQNCIFWGSDGLAKDEVVVEKKGSSAISVIMDHCLYKAETTSPNLTATSVILNKDPNFDSIQVNGRIYNFRTSTKSSPAVDAGSATTFQRDLDNNRRAVGVTDIGCYEKQ